MTTRTEDGPDVSGIGFLEIDEPLLEEAAGLARERRRMQRRMEIGRRTRPDRRAAASQRSAQTRRARPDRRMPGERRKLPDRRIGLGAARELSRIDFSELDA